MNFFKDVGFRNLKYEEGKTYLYEFETSAKSSVPGSSTIEESSSFSLKGTAALTIESGCNYILTIQQATLKTSSGQVLQYLTL